MPNFIDMFAGAGGFSEGFLQAEENGKQFNFLLASDINSTCEVTHRMRYNHQLGLNTEFLTKDITDPDFVEELLSKIERTFGKTQIDVLTGGPPCQSFSLAGERRKNDKKDDLFSYYLKVIEIIRPKYFVMENVAGILTKDGGRIKERILREIKNIVDYNALESFVSLCERKSFLSKVYSSEEKLEFEIGIKVLKIWIEENSLFKERRDIYLKTVSAVRKEKLDKKQKIFIEEALLSHKNEISNHLLEQFCAELSSKLVEAYRNDKETPEDDRNVIRQALFLVAHQAELSSVREKIKREINFAQLKRSEYKEKFDRMTDDLSLDQIVNIAGRQCKRLTEKTTNEKAKRVLEEIKLSLEILFEGVYATMTRVLKIAENIKGDSSLELQKSAKNVALYQIEQPIQLLASDYGVPQNRIRVVFIGCRNDQKLITRIPATIAEGEKVTVAEAIGDLNYIKIGDHPYHYDEDFFAKFRLTTQGSIERTAVGVLKQKAEGQECHTYAEWSRIGRLSVKRFPQLQKQLPAYTAANTYEEIENKPINYAVLQNHESSKHNKEVQDRYALMREYGDYRHLKEKKPDHPLLKTKKRNYTVLNPNGQSTTITTMPDDFVHYAANRSLTVREMARLQSFDDSFVFQGKRATGGDKRKVETPQFTQVGNAVPPLMARAIAAEILKNIE